MFIIFGLMLIYTPQIMFLMSGGRSEEDMVIWLMSKPLQFTLMIRFCLYSGIGFLGIGLLNHSYILFK